MPTSRFPTSSDPPKHLVKTLGSFHVFAPDRFAFYFNDPDVFDEARLSASVWCMLCPCQDEAMQTFYERVLSVRGLGGHMRHEENECELS